MTLLELKNEQKARLITLPNNEAAERLEALGLHCGKVIVKISNMPFGGPVTVMLQGRHFAVSHSIASEIEIELIKDD